MFRPADTWVLRHPVKLAEFSVNSFYSEGAQITFGDITPSMFAAFVSQFLGVDCWMLSVSVGRWWTFLLLVPQLCIARMHMENAQLVNFSDGKTLQILTIYFFPTLPAQNTNQQKK